MDFREKYFNLWKEAWSFHKKWFTNKGSPEEWEQITTEAGGLYKQHQDEPFLKELLLMVLSELEREDRRKKKDGDMQEAGEIATDKNIDK